MANLLLYIEFCRVVIDGEGSNTVFNGHEFHTDIKFTRINNYISGKFSNVEKYVL